MLKGSHLRILQANVGKSNNAHDTILNIAFERKIDILLIQEPRIRNPTRKLTRNHPAYQCFTSWDVWTERPPRVLTYIRKGAGLHCSQLSLVTSPDLLFLKIKGKGFEEFTLINVYNAPDPCIDGGLAVQQLIQLPSFGQEDRLICAGDFNLKHPLWQPGIAPSPTAQKWIDWAEASHLNLISTPGKATHQRGNILDLTWASATFTNIYTTMDHSLDSTSDHSTILTILTTEQEVIGKAIGRFRMETTEQETFQSILTASLPKIRPFPTPEYLDSFVEHLISALNKALQASTKTTLGHGKPIQYWNEECKAAHRKFTTQKNLIESLKHLGLDTSWEDEELKAARSKFASILSAERKKYWNLKISKASSSKEIFEMIGWHKSIGQYSSPPLKDPSNGAIAQTPEEKRLLLAEHLLKNKAETADIPLDLSALPSSEVKLPFPSFTKQEIENSILKAGSTAPGKDKITTSVLKLAWAQIRDHVKALFDGCLALGHHPKAFRDAVLVIIEKPAKKDKSNPRAYRPIALLSVLGKGLERLVAKRMSWIAIKCNVLHKQQFGALPLSSCTDLASSLIWDIEKAWASGKVASLLTLDIKGAFDAVLPGRLVHRLAQQGWDKSLLRWIASFATQRTAQISWDNETGAPFSLECGLPQGSPISPILFMLYIEPVFKLGSNISINRYGYADDMAFLSTSTTLEKNCTILRQKWEEVLSWGQSQGITFDFEKSELLHLTKNRKHKNPPISVVKPDKTTHTVTPIAEKATLRWLGVFFDRKLTFKHHVDYWSTKAARIANGIRTLGTLANGPSPKLMTQAIKACVLPIAYYAAEAWWPSRTRTQKGKITSNRVLTLVRKLDIVQNKAMRAALPVYRTTPVAVLQREASIPPAEIYLDSKLQALAVRVHRLDKKHPLRRRLEKQGQEDTRLARACAVFQDAEFTDPICFPPWLAQPTWEEALQQVGYRTGRDKKTAAEEFLVKMQTVSKRDIVAYTDGSLIELGGMTYAGAGWTGLQGEITLFNGSMPLGRNCEVYDAEAFAALAGLKAALSSPITHLSDRIIICLDNLAVAARLLHPTTGSSQATFAEFKRLANTWPSRERAAWTQAGRVEVWWCPGHSKIPGNEAADKLAGEAARAPAVSPIPATLAHIKRKSKASALKAHQITWQSTAPKLYQDLGITVCSNPPELSLPRASLSRIYAARTGHGDFAAYHKRLHHTDAFLSCSCGRPKSQLHLFYCTRAKRSKIQDHKANIEYFLGSTKGAMELAKWLEDTKFSEIICPSRPATR
jgi:ribonuclease HI